MGLQGYPQIELHVCSSGCISQVSSTPHKVFIECICNVSGICQSNILLCDITWLLMVRRLEYIVDNFPEMCWILCMLVKIVRVILSFSVSCLPCAHILQTSVVIKILGSASYFVAFPQGIPEMVEHYKFVCNPRKVGPPILLF
ncbi:hypothetical protein FKM82_022498 [Ascaphus truei]